MFLRDDILEPIPGDNPGGEDLYYSPLFDKIQAARKQEAENPQAGDEGAAKAADFGKVVELGEEALAAKTKDLRLASWIAEALIYEHGFAGLNEGIQLLHGLVENFWESLYPAVEDEEDLEDRAAPLEWFGNYFAPGSRSSPSLAVRLAPLSKSGYGWLRYKESRKVPYEDDQAKGKPEERKEAVEQNKLPPEQFDSDFAATPKPFYKELCAHLAASRQSLPALESFCDKKFGAQFAPSFAELRKALEEIELDAKSLLKKKLEQDPDPVAPVAVEGAAGTAEEGEGGADTKPAGPVLVTLKSSEELAALEPADRSEAVNRILAVAQYLRVREPQSPVPYLMLRALRWGELRARANGQAAGGEPGGQEFEPGFLQAPSAEVRVALRRYAAGSDWRHVLETAERAMGEPCGRGCLDLQRYSIQACEQLGYTAAAAAMLSELRALLKDLPHLTGMTLSDETGAANPATMSWLNEAVLAQQG